MFTIKTSNWFHTKEKLQTNELMMNGSEQWEWQQDEWMNMLIYEIKQIWQIVQMVQKCSNLQLRQWMVSD